MRVSTAVLLFLALFAAVAQKKADVQILETKAVREGAKISVDGKVRVTRENPLRGLVIVFDFRSPEKEVVTSQKAVIDEDTLETGREGVFTPKWQIPRAPSATPCAPSTTMTESCAWPIRDHILSNKQELPAPFYKSFTT